MMQPIRMRTAIEMRLFTSGKASSSSPVLVLKVPKERVGTLISFESFALCERTVFFFCVSIQRTMQYVLSLTFRSSLFERRATKRSLLCIIT